MTFRAKPVTKRARPGSTSSRRTLYLNIGFTLVVVLAILILIAAAGASWYGDHFGSVALVNGQAITRDQFRDQFTIEAFRLDRAKSRVQDEFQAGHLTAAERDQAAAAIDQQRTASTLQQQAYEDLIDQSIMATLANEQGITVTDADIDAQITTEATTPELRHSWVIAVKPEISTGASDATDAQKAAAKAKADQALTDLQSGKKWEDVAKAVSADPTAGNGGDLGWLQAADTSQDKPFLDAVFAAQVNTPTAVVTGADGIYRIGRVTEKADAQVDPNWTQSVTNSGISLDTYRRAVRAEVVATKLREKITASIVDTATPQRRVSEIKIPTTQHTGGGDEIQVRHILFAPNHLTDQTQLGALASNDPAWTKAQQDAQAAYDALKAYVGNPTELEKQFQDLANKETDDSSGKGSGGELPFFTHDDVDRAFGDAIFKPGLKKDDLLAPVKSQFGWHVILWESQRPNAQGRINEAALEASRTGANFADIAKTWSEGAEKDKGGDIGWVAKYQLPQQLEDAIFKTPVGGVSDVVDVPNDAFYLFKVVEEQSRKPDGDQAATLRENVFNTWYQGQKGDTNKFKIERQLTFNTTTQ
jgi:parvulin-like peptidyl-prolyl isomerase